MYWSQLTAFETGITGALALLIWFGYSIFYWIRLPKSELALRSGLLAAGLVCLCCIIWKPQYAVTQAAGKALILTELTNTIPDSIPVFALPSASISKQAMPITDVALLERMYPDIEEVYISGYNLEPEQVTALQRLNVHFLNRTPPAGFHWLAYDRTVAEGEPIVVSGSYRNTTPDSVKITFLTAEGPQDSAILAPGKTAFSLRAYPKVSGNYLATIQVTTADQTRNEPIPFRVMPKQSLQIALIQAFPSFEVNYLKDWLAGQKHQVQAQAQVSREALAAQQINTHSKGKTSSLLAVQSLAKTDLLILDEESLRRLTATQQLQLKNAVQQGLGLLVLPQDQWLQTPAVFSQSFPLRATGVRQFIAQPVAARQSAGREIEKFPYAFAANPLLVPIVQSKAHEMVAAFRPLGSGRIGAELATNTFTWILNGEEQTYSDFWTAIIQALSRRKKELEVDIRETPFVWQDQPAKLHISDSLISPITIRYASQVTQTVRPMREVAEGVTYPVRPAEAGWMQVQVGADSSQTDSVYVLPSTAWNDLRQAAFWRKNQQFKSTATASASTISVPKDVPLIWFFVPLLASFGLLWWREKTQKV